MKTRDINFKLKIPAWWPYKHQWKSMWRTLLYKIKPDHCQVCSTRVDFDGRDFEGIVHNQRVLLSQYELRPICGHCLAKKIKEYYARSYMADAKCDCCGQVKRVTSGITDVNAFQLSDEEYNHNKSVAKQFGLDVRYGMAWWNGFSLCKECICEMLEQNNSKSSFSMSFRGKTYYINHRGAMILIKGKSL